VTNYFVIVSDLICNIRYIFSDILFCHSIWDSILTFYLASILTSCLASFKASILTFSLAFFLRFYLACVQAFFLASFLAFYLPSYSDSLFWHSIWHLFWHSLRHGHCRASNASARSQWPGSWGRAATDLGSSRLSSISAELRSLQLPEEEEKKEEKEATLTKSSDPHVAGYQKSIVQRGQCWSHWNTLLLPA